MMNGHDLLTVFAGFSKVNQIEEYVVYYLDKLSQISDVIIVFDNEFSDNEIRKIEKYSIINLCNHHGGYDFGSYKIGYEYAWNHNILDKYKALLFCNDSMFGPFFSLSSYFKKMNNNEVDYWGVFEQKENEEKASIYEVPHLKHIQSYFIVFRRQVFLSECFASFVKNIEFGLSRDIVIQRYEIGLSNYLTDNNFIGKALYSSDEDINSWINDVLPYIKRGFPFLKKKAVISSKNHYLEYLLNKKKMANYINNYDLRLIDNFTSKIGYSAEDALTDNYNTLSKNSSIIKKILKQRFSPRTRHLIKTRVRSYIPKINVINLVRILFQKVLLNKTVVVIKHPSPIRNNTHFGDLHLARDLKKNLNDDDFYVIDHCLEQWNYFETRLADIVIVLRGGDYYKTRKSNYNIMWLISHPDDIKIPEYDYYDYICVASEKFANDLKEKVNVPVSTVSQFSDPGKFYPIEDERYKSKILFVGNTRGQFREVVRYCVEAGLDISVYGNGWEKFIEPSYIKGKSLPNEDLGKYYSNADIVLNDHWQDMKDNGFVSNRIYDVTLCGGFLISDYLEEIEKNYDDSIVMYKNREDFIEKIRYYMNHPQERRAKAAKARQVTLGKYNAKYIAEQMRVIIKGRVNE